MNIIGGLTTKSEKRKYRSELGFFNHIWGQNKLSGTNLKKPNLFTVPITKRK